MGTPVNCRRGTENEERRTKRQEDGCRRRSEGRKSENGIGKTKKDRQ
jgi:hypothetical protein